jgi:hypothetical protein
VLPRRVAEELVDRFAERPGALPELALGDEEVSILEADQNVGLPA